MLHNIFIIKVVWHHGETQSVAKLGIPKKSYLIKHNVISATILQYFFYSELFRRTVDMSITSSELIRVQVFFYFDCLIFLNKSRVQIELTDKKRRGNGKRAKKMVQKTEMSEFQDLTSKERFKEKRMRDWDGGWLLRSEVFTDLISTPCLSLYKHSHSFISSMS